jgi:hypothetical protein
MGKRRFQVESCKTQGGEDVGSWVNIRGVPDQETNPWKKRVYISGFDSHSHFYFSTRPSHIYLKRYFFAGDRAANLLGVKTVDILRFLDDSGKAYKRLNNLTGFFQIN